MGEASGLRVCDTVGEVQTLPGALDQRMKRGIGGLLNPQSSAVAQN
jgi:hypothetical protein